jgi:hypothetical protein
MCAADGSGFRRRIEYDCQEDARKYFDFSEIIFMAAQ